jgi:hypothetical protein
MHCFFWWGIESGALNVDVASEGCEIGELGEETFEFRVETITPCYEFETGSLLCLDKVNAVCFVKERLSKETNSVQVSVNLHLCSTGSYLKICI